MNWLTDALENDLDPVETREWMESLKAVLDADGPERAHHLLQRMVELTRRAGAHLPFQPTTEYINTIPPHLEAKSDGDAMMEWRIRSIIRWRISSGSKFRPSPPPRPCRASCACATVAQHIRAATVANFLNQFFMRILL